MEFYAHFVERHGMPWVVGKATKGAGPADKRAMAADIARMVRDCVAVIPSGAEVNLLAPANTSELLHERFIARQDKAISKLLMGQTLTVEMEGKNNSQAATETHNDVAEGLANADKAMVQDAMNEIAWLYTRVNAGRDVLAPIFSYEEPEDLSARADLDKKLYDMGVSFTAEHFQDNYNLKPTEFTMRAAPAPGASPGPPFEFSAVPRREHHWLVEGAQARLDAAIKKIMPEALKASGQFITQVENVVRRAQSPDELELLLADLLAPHTAPSEMESLLARTMTAAAGFGAASVHVEAEGED
jgi:phage gp29-like protein